MTIIISFLLHALSFDSLMVPRIVFLPLWLLFLLSTKIGDTILSLYTANRRNHRIYISLVLRIELCSLQTYRNLFLFFLSSSSHSSCVLTYDRGGVCILIYKNRSTEVAPVS
jgi:hypothetical protein